jgi:hypothetical protein
LQGHEIKHALSSPPRRCAGLADPSDDSDPIEQIGCMLCRQCVRRADRP